MKSSTRRIATDAMLAAMYVCLSYVSLSIGNSMKITLDSLPILVTALLLGPLDGLAVGLTGSFLSQLLTYGLSATTILWILPAGIRGLVVGLYAKSKGFALSRPQLIFITTASALLVTALNTLVMYLDSVIIGYPFAATLPTVFFRILSGVLIAVAFSFILPPLLNALKKLTSGS